MTAREIFPLVLRRCFVACIRTANALRVTSMRMREVADGIGWALLYNWDARGHPSDLLETRRAIQRRDFVDRLLFERRWRKPREELTSYLHRYWVLSSGHAKAPYIIGDEDRRYGHSYCVFYDDPLGIANSDYDDYGDLGVSEAERAAFLEAAGFASTGKQLRRIYKGVELVAPSGAKLFAGHATSPKPILALALALPTGAAVATAQGTVVLFPRKFANRIVGSSTYGACAECDNVTKGKWREADFYCGICWKEYVIASGFCLGLKRHPRAHMHTHILIFRYDKPSMVA